MSVFGVDYAWSHPGVAALRKAGVRFACRYLSRDAGKNLTRGEAEELSAAGIWLVVVWETTASRALSGRAGGAADARAAEAQARACGMPDGRPIYFAVDWDASTGQQATINAYLDGAASVIGRERVGMYAGYGPIKRAFDAEKITFGWQTYAWSGGRWDSRAQLQQYSNDERINGVGLDYDRAVKDDYGQWMVGEDPDVALSSDDKKWLTDNLFKLVLQQDKVAAPAGVDPTGNPTWRPDNLLREIYSRALEIKAGVAQLAQQSLDVDEAEVARLVLAGLTPESIGRAVVEAFPAGMATKVVDEIQARLAS
ncbi:glycoside hydrolase domain-containing protein [Actinomadura litoris]|uniref:glycoside hydrolase domain-containing protein n=1 Tax=Actinomadura litoris TaxID=2678616 RepID=UPI001FE44EAD|nr:glycoside hydrolase domain-containing protein [Actinomadura litoris]